ncbi:ATPase [Novosphingobium subterraneum]|jgi:ATP-binding protein involved in chromosome partitioning|uniref:Iron-sulfur cluster carrier protein n=2 Tax=Novosphingobium subterraneum TaxID=48936 RepID=A0A0B8ZL29_9SPHN|nr:ATPase [Novosphingobium subterraneum]
MERNTGNGVSIDEQALRNALGEVAGDRLQTVKVADDTATVMLEVGGLERLDRDKLEMAVRDAARKAGVGDLRLGMTAERKSRVIIAVGSGKGGVGKSTLSANLAVALHRLGRKVGLVDADIYGPSQPRLLLTEGRKPEAEDNKIHPIPSPYGVPMLSMGHLVQPGQAIAWRGPMAGNALGQLIDAHWGEVEIIVVDLPPGTGDVQLTMLSKHKPAGAVIVSTPQDLALMDATRAIGLFEQGKVPIIGMVENMAGYICPHCGEESDPFGVGGAEAAAKTMGLPFLGRVPLDMAIRRESDAGNPPAAGDSPQAEAFLSIARSVLAWLDGKR